MSLGFQSGKLGKLVIGSDTYKIKHWSLDLPSAILDVTNGGGGGIDDPSVPVGGYGQYIAGVADMDFTVELDHDVGSSPFATDFVVGTILASVFLYVDPVSAHFWRICGAIVQDAGESLDVRGLASIRMTAKATGGNYAFHENDDPTLCP
jgi:hypothetical protein